MMEEVESADVLEPPIVLTDDIKPLEEARANIVDVPAITSEIETNTKTDLQLQSDAGLLTKMEESPLTATIFIAAPLVKNHNLEIIGEDKHLGEWKNPQGKFEPILQISTDIFIFKGTVPIPALPGSDFKFVHVNINNQNKEYEGKGPWDNRKEELLPDSWNFFLFKPKIESMFAILLGRLTTFIHKSETKKRIASDFCGILFNHAISNVLPDWDGAFEFLSDGIRKILKEIGFQSSDGFLAFLTLRLQNPELLFNFDHLFLLTVGACRMDVFPEKMMKVLGAQSREFSLYLHNFRNLKRKRQDLMAILEHIAINAGRDFWWILFRINRHFEVLRNDRNQEVSAAILKTLQEIPQVLLKNQESTTRIVDYLIRWNDIDDLYADLRPVFEYEQGVNYQQFIDTLLLTYLLLHKTTVEDLKKILNSKFLKNIFQRILIPSVPRSVKPIANVETVLTMPTRTTFDEPADLNDPQSNGVAVLFKETIQKMFNQKLMDVARLASCTPDYLLPFVVPIVETKLKTLSNFSWEDYGYFAQQEDNNFDNFPQFKQGIEAMVSKMTVDLVKSGSFQDVASLKLVLVGLTESEGSIPFLKRPKIVDLREAISSLPRNFFQNLHSVVKKPGVPIDKTLKPYRNGSTRSVVVQLDHSILYRKK